MDINDIGGYNLTNLGKINVILGKNGCGKSTLLKNLESNIAGNRGEDWGITKYITPERGGILTYDAGIEQNITNDSNWLLGTRRVNQYSQFRQQSIAQYRKLELMILREIDRSKRSDLSYSFQNYIDKINGLLDNIEIRQSENDSIFKIYSKNGGNPISPERISSGESELISLAIECLIFEKELIPQKKNILFLDEPDVHLHPDLQSRLIKFLINLINDNFIIILATHSTALLGELTQYDEAKISFMKSGDKNLEFKNITDIYKKVLPVFGAHPLSNIFNQAPILLLEGDDDERIWQTVVRCTSGKLRIYPCSCGSISIMNQFEVEAKTIISSVYDSPKGFSLRDKDDSLEEIDDILPIIRSKLSCRSSENLLLTNEVLSTANVTWDLVKQRIDAWIQSNTTHTKFSFMKNFQDSSYDRKNFDIKEIRMILVGQIIGENKPWEVLIGKSISNFILMFNTEYDPLKFDIEGTMMNFLGKKTVNQIIQPNILRES